MKRKGRGRTAGRTDKTGRSKLPNGGFLQLHRWMMESPAWRSLSPQERTVYTEIAALYTGANNGFLAASVRWLAERCNISKDTAMRSVQTLIHRGFLECTQEGAFHVKTKIAAEFRLTQFRCDRTSSTATKAFIKWRPADPEKEKLGPKPGTPRSQTGDVVVLRCA